jgi:hypothetical protein
MASKVKDTIVNKIKRLKYFATLLDCTVDAGPVELNIILRYVDTETGCIEENFVGFIPVQETSPATLTDAILSELRIQGLDINDCRGQGYDNAANTVGVN